MPEYRHIDHVGEHEEHTKMERRSQNEFAEYTLPELALNEVFIGESLSARVSYYEMGVDDRSRTKQKSSGVTVCTGTGSYSWYFNINQLSELNLRVIIDLLNAELANRRAVPRGFYQVRPSPSSIERVPHDDPFIRVVAQRFNNALRYPATERRMAYSVRDPVVNSMSRLFAFARTSDSARIHTQVVSILLLISTD